MKEKDTVDNRRSTGVRLDFHTIVGTLASRGSIAKPTPKIDGEMGLLKNVTSQMHSILHTALFISQMLHQPSRQFLASFSKSRARSALGPRPTWAGCPKTLYGKVKVRGKHHGHVLCEFKLSIHPCASTTIIKSQEWIKMLSKL